MNQYGGFWRRWWAWVIDAGMFLPLAPFNIWLWSESKLWATVATIAQGMLNPIYFVAFHALRGQSLGKMALRLKVEMADGKPISWRAAIIRFSPLVVFHIIWTIGVLLAITSLSEAELMTGSFLQTARLLTDRRPAWVTYFNTVYTVWLVADVIVLVNSSRKRAIHDLLGGTVVRQASAGTVS